LSARASPIALCRGRGDGGEPEGGGDHALAGGAEKLGAPIREGFGIGGGELDFAAELGQIGGEAGGNLGVDAIDDFLDKGPVPGVGIAEFLLAGFGLLEFFKGFKVGALGGGGFNGVVLDKIVALLDADEHGFGLLDGVEIQGEGSGGRGFSREGKRGRW